MILEETLSDETGKYIKRKSENGFYLRKIKLGGNEELYEIAVDLYEFKDIITYEETDIKIPILSIDTESEF